MNIYPDLETASGYAKEYNSIPVMSEVIADLITPMNAFMSIKSVYEHCYLLESAENERRFGRYSFIGYGAKQIISYQNGELTNSQLPTPHSLPNPFPYIDEIIKSNISPVMPGMPKFTGGLVGYFGYDTARFIEPTISETPPDDLNIPDIMLMDCEYIIVFDHLRHRALLITQITGFDKEPFADCYNKAKKRLEDMRTLLKNLPPPVKPIKKAPSSTQMLISREDYIKNVQKAKEYIIDGDIFQVVLSERTEITNPPDSFNVYRSLRADEPSPYMYYLSFGNLTIVGSSPEKLVSAENGLVTTNPIAGTIRRGKTEQEDKELEQSLITNEKERAEHIMLVDLSRNDIGKICEFGTVAVDRLMEVERFSKLMHIVSSVSGTLQQDLSLTSVLAACLPAGTLSGAPKIRAMQIIDELETRKRCAYGGATGYIGYNGVMDTCITIRSAFFVNDKAYIQTGAGIVADSDPASEYEETQTKAKAMLAAFEKAGDII